jgi:phage-related protein
MALPVFSWAVSYDTQMSATPVLLKAQFGDGYVQRARNGINNVVPSWPIKIDVLENSDAIAIDNFLTELGGCDPFYWRNPYGIVGRYICEAWTLVPHVPGRSDFTATFIQDFSADPDLYLYRIVITDMAVIGVTNVLLDARGTSILDSASDPLRDPT